MVPWGGGGRVNRVGGSGGGGGCALLLCTSKVSEGRLNEKQMCCPAAQIPQMF